MKKIILILVVVSVIGCGSVTDNKVGRSGQNVSSKTAPGNDEKENIDIENAISRLEKALSKMRKVPAENTTYHRFYIPSSGVTGCWSSSWFDGVFEFDETLYVEYKGETVINGRNDLTTVIYYILEFRRKTITPLLKETVEVEYEIENVEQKVKAGGNYFITDRNKAVYIGNSSDSRNDFKRFIMKR